MTSRVPQGTVLVPLLFLCFIYDITKDISSSIILQKVQSHISTVFGQFSYLNSYVYSSFQKNYIYIYIYINPQSNPHFGLFLSLNTCYSYLNCVLNLTMTDVAKAIQDLCDQFKSLRENVYTLKKRKSKKSKKSKSQKSYLRTPAVTGTTALEVELL